MGVGEPATLLRAASLVGDGVTRGVILMMDDAHRDDGHGAAADVAQATDGSAPDGSAPVSSGS